MPSKEIRQKLGEMMMFGFDGTAVSDDVRRLISEYRIGGVILFPRNLESPAQVRALTASLQELASGDLLISVDHEGRGGRFSIGLDFTAFNLSNLKKFLAGDPGVCRRVGNAMGRELAAVGINMDLAPVLDVNTNRENPIIGERALSGDPDEVAKIGLGIAAGLNDAGIAACGKHFPGHGDTSADSHKERPTVAHSRSRLDEIELRPFKAAARSGIDSIMTAHVVYPALDSENPATISHDIVTGLLRVELGYSGVVITDDLRMKSLSSHMPVEEAALKSVLAGADIALICREIDIQMRAIELFCRAADGGALSDARINDACGRIRALKSRYLPAFSRPELAVIGCEEHRWLAGKIGNQRPPASR